MSSEESMRKIEIVEISKNAVPQKLMDSYSTPNYYDVSVRQGPNSWRIELSLKSRDEPLERRLEWELFERHVEEPRVFAAMSNGKQIGWIEVGHRTWNDRMRIWEFLVKEEFRNRGVGTLLMDKAVSVAKEAGARMLVLETDTSNVPAIGFYMRYGFKLIGLDIAAYSNRDIESKQVRLDFGLELDQQNS